MADLELQMLREERLRAKMDAEQISREEKRASAEEKAWEKQGRENRSTMGGKAQKVQEVIGSIGSGIRTLMPRGMKDPNRMVRNRELYTGDGSPISPIRGMSPRMDKSLLVPTSNKLRQTLPRPGMRMGMNKNLVLPKRMSSTRPLKSVKKVTFRKNPGSKKIRLF
jgi:hypothetical protein